MQKLDQFIKILNEILVYAEMESTKINSGYFSKWNQKQLENVVCPEINELLSFALKGKVFFKYGKKQRMLESTHLITDSLSALDKTPLGSKILELQKLFNSF